MIFIDKVKRMIHRLEKFMKINLWVLVLIIVAIVSCEKKPRFQNYFPETGKKALYQRALDLKNNLNVLSIALQPGKEDLAALAYFRLGKGATIMSAYVTNGEAGESDMKAEYPPYLAAARRKEAAKAISYLDGEAYFLNMPDIAAARDTAKVRSIWQADTLRTRLKKLIVQFKPDIILIAPDWITIEENPMLRVLYTDLLTAIDKASTSEAKKNIAGLNSINYWNVQRVFLGNHEGAGMTIPYDQRHPKWKKTYRTIAQEASLKYNSLKVRRPLWLRKGDPSYLLVYPKDERPITELDEGLHQVCTPRFQSIQQQIDNLADSIMKGKTKHAITRLVAIKDSVSIYLVQRYMLRPCEREALFDWNQGMENLHCSLLGVQVKYRISDTKLTAVQITYLTIDEIKGIHGEDGNTEIFFSGTDQGWIINEDVKRKLPLKLHERYRLVSPKRVMYSFPPGHQKILLSNEGTPYYFFIIHHAKDRENKFIYRAKINFFFGPRFVTEVLTPIVRMKPKAKVAIRLTNLSRDGVEDIIKVDDKLATSQALRFRLPGKESFIVDTLRIKWKGNAEEGSYLIPIRIGRNLMANFVARKFNVEFDSSKNVGIIPEVENSATEFALRQMEMKYKKVNLDQDFGKQIQDLDILIIDRALLTFKPAIYDLKDKLDDFVKQGGHLIILAQDADSWNSMPLWEGIELKPSVRFDETYPVRVNPTHRFITSPNMITPDHWTGWLFQRSYHFVNVNLSDNAKMPVKTKQIDNPLIVTMEDGKGRRTYIDLAFNPQFMNIHPGAFRLFANIISY